MNQQVKPNAQQFGKVAVIMGGTSAEREISLISGQAVLEALLAQGIDAHKFDPIHDVQQQLQAGNFDRAFIILHGRGGEDGFIQRQLEQLAIPYTGSKVIGCEQSLDKIRAKQLWLQQGLPTAEFVQVGTADESRSSEAKSIVAAIGLPLFIKPVNEGSSIGMSKVMTTDQLDQAIALAQQFDNKVMAERWINGEEYTVAILNNQALLVVQLKTPNAFYDFDAKYLANTTEYICPSDLDQQAGQQCQQLALDAFNGLAMEGWGRIDLMRDQTGQFYLLEANSIPGMTSHSLVPMAAQQAGLTFAELVLAILATSIEGAQ